jgi:hypothetical protein
LIIPLLHGCLLMAAPLAEFVLGPVADRDRSLHLVCTSLLGNNMQVLAR